MNRWEAAMRNDEEKRLEVGIGSKEAGEHCGEHVVFDLSGTVKANVEDIALILTARLQSPPTDSVWVHSMPSRTAEILRYLRLQHLFRLVPETEGDLN
ncbi:MAG: hypothetical protein ACPGPI_10245 [Longimicrobiales bacterium]